MIATPTIPFNRPYVAGRELEYMQDALARGHVSGDGYYTNKASKLLADITSVPEPLLTTSCTHALEMTAMLAELEPGDEVILPSFTFVSCANAFVRCGARPIFVDIRSDTFNIDERLIERAITPRTKIIVVVHYAGVACEMSAILEIAARHGVMVVEDAAHGLGASYEDMPLGSLGHLGALSFHETKNVHCGEGGALLINDPALRERAEIIREKGTDRSRFFRGQVDKYTWTDIGSSYLPSDLLGAFLTAQLECFDDIQRQRQAIWATYANELPGWAEANGFTLPTIPDGRRASAHLFGLLAPDRGQRDRLIEQLASRSIKAVFHYVPLHSSPMGRRYAPDLTLPVTDQVSDRLVRLPLFAGLQSDELSRVVDAVRSFGS